MDVRNAAEAHVLAAETPGAKGRYVVADGSVDFLQLADTIRARGGVLLPRVYLPSWLVFTFGVRGCVLNLRGSEPRTR